MGSYRFTSQDNSWRNEGAAINDALIALDAEEQDEYQQGIHLAQRYAEEEDQAHILLDLARHYLNQVEAEIAFLYLKDRRNKDISLILGIQEPEVARYKAAIIRKLKVYYKYKHEIDIKLYVPFIQQVCELNNKQAGILRSFFSFHSLARIGEEHNSKGSNMHRSLNAIKQRIEEQIKTYPFLQIALDFWQDSRYVNTSNPQFTLIQEVI